MDTTKAAIEASKKSKGGNGGRQRFLVLGEKEVKILKRDAKVSGSFFVLIASFNLEQNLPLKLTSQNLRSLKQETISTYSYAG